MDTLINTLQTIYITALLKGGGESLGQKEGGLIGLVTCCYPTAPFNHKLLLRLNAILLHSLQIHRRIVKLNYKVIVGLIKYY